MKKLTLTFCALSVLASALYAGTENYSGKEKEVLQPAPPVCDWYRAHEWDLDLWGSFMFSANPGRFDVPRVDPFSPDIDPTVFDTTVGAFVEPRSLNPNERINLGQLTKDQLIARDNTFGGGLDLKYFWSRYFGAGVEGIFIPAKTNFAGAELATLTVRYPINRFAPYAWGGIGAIEGGGTQFRFFNEDHTFTSGNATGEQEFFTSEVVQNKHTRGIGQLGIGFEVRITCHVGLMADFSWNFVFGKEESADRFETVISPAASAGGLSPITNTAINLHPGTGSDNQDFGMARFGVTLSY